MTPLNRDFFTNTDRPEPRPAMISIPLDLPDVRVLDTQINDQGEIIITVESTLEEATWVQGKGGCFFSRQCCIGCWQKHTACCNS